MQEPCFHLKIRLFALIVILPFYIAQNWGQKEENQTPSYEQVVSMCTYANYDERLNYTQLENYRGCIVDSGASAYGIENYEQFYRGLVGEDTPLYCSDYLAR